MKENLTYNYAVKFISKILKIDNPKVVILKTKEEFQYFASNNKSLFDANIYSELENSIAMGCTLEQSQVVLILDYNIKQPIPVYKQLANIEIIAHELRHVWQLQHGWIFDYTLPYFERAHEKDAYKFAAMTVLPMLIAIGIPSYILQYKIYKGIKNKVFKK